MIPPTPGVLAPPKLGDAVAAVVEVEPLAANSGGLAQQQQQPWPWRFRVKVRASGGAEMRLALYRVEGDGFVTTKEQIELMYRAGADQEVTNAKGAIKRKWAPPSGGHEEKRQQYLQATQIGKAIDS